MTYQFITCCFPGEELQNPISSYRDSQQSWQNVLVNHIVNKDRDNTAEDNLNPNQPQLKTVVLNFSRTIENTTIHRSVFVGSQHRIKLDNKLVDAMKECKGGIFKKRNGGNFLLKLKSKSNAVSYLTENEYKTQSINDILSIQGSQLENGYLFFEVQEEEICDDDSNDL